VSRTQAHLKAAADQCSWQPDVEILVLGGYIAKHTPSLDPDRFAEATAKYSYESGLPIELVVQVLCGLVDSMPEKSCGERFVDYVAGVVAEFRKLNQPAAPEPAPVAAPVAAPPVAVVQIIVGAAVTSEIDQLIKSERPFSDFEIGDIMFKWRAKLDLNNELSLEVCNADPTPALVITITPANGGKIIHRHRPVRSAQWNALQPCEGGRKLVIPGASVELIFKAG
jgi:hypothetical protein